MNGYMKHNCFGQAEEVLDKMKVCMLLTHSKRPKRNET